MNIWESIATSWRAIYTNKLRSSLTILGIVIGISAVVFLVSFGRGQQANIVAVFQNMGVNVIRIAGTVGMRTMSGATGTLTLEDAEALVKPNRAPSIALVSPTISKLQNVAYSNENVNINIMGVTTVIAQIASYPLAQGEFISEGNVQKVANVAVLGSNTAKNLFKTEDPLGKCIRISGRKFEVIGVLAPRGGMMGSADGFVMIPLSTMQSRIIGETSARGRPVGTITIQAVSSEEIDAAKEQATTILRQRHHLREGKDDDFTITDMREILQRRQQTMAVFGIFLSSAGAISLVVGGIGIMNIMLVSVAERVREIGIRKAVGAKRRDILLQFLIESAMLSFTGGIIGLMLAIIATQLVKGKSMGAYPINVPMSLDIIIIALSVALLVGLASGSYPAFRAAGLDPIESLRSE